MTSRRLLLLASFGLALGPVCGPVQADRKALPASPVGGILTEIQGSVEVQRPGGAPQKVDFTTLLPPGTVVRSDAGSSAVLILPDGSRATVSADGTRTLSAGAPGPLFLVLARQLKGVLDPQAAPLDLRGYQLRGYQLRGYQLRGDGEEPPLLLTAPRENLLPEGKPHFRWQARELKDATLNLYDAEENVVWTRRLKTSDTDLSYPGTLKPGTYKWEVVGKVMEKPELSGASFVVPNPSAGQAASTRLAAAQKLGAVATALVALEHRLFPEAEAAIAEARKGNPGDRTLRLLHARVLSETRRNVPDELITAK